MRTRLALALPTLALSLGGLVPGAPVPGAPVPEPAERTVEPTALRTEPAVARRGAGVARLRVPAKVWTGTRFVARVRPPVLRGSVRPKALLQVGRPGGWRTEARARIKRSVVWRPVVRAGARPTGLRLRVVVPRRGKRAGWRSPTVTVRVLRRVTTPKPRPPVREPVVAQPSWDRPEYTDASTAAGSASDWTWMDEVNRPTWPDCTVIRWAYDPSGSYGDSLGDVQRSFARVSGASGLRFRYVGDSRGLPATSYDVGVSWAPANAFGEGVIGLTSFRYTIGGAVSRIKGGTIRFNNDLDLTVGMHAPPGEISTGQLFQHEIMHVVGLGHAASDTQLMYPYATTNEQFGAGDRAGLRAVGSTC